MEKVQHNSEENQGHIPHHRFTDDNVTTWKCTKCSYQATTPAPTAEKPPTSPPLPGCNSAAGGNHQWSEILTNLQAPIYKCSNCSQSAYNNEPTTGCQGTNPVGGNHSFSAITMDHKNHAVAEDYIPSRD